MNIANALLSSFFQNQTDNCTFDNVQFYNKSGNEGVGVISIEGNNFKITNCVLDNFYEVFGIKSQFDSN